MAEATSVFKSVEHGQKLAEGNAKFALDMYKQIISDSGSKNVFYSPGSISVALAMTCLGARNNTAAEMKETLSLSALDDSNLHATFEDLFRSLSETGGDYTLHLANRLFAEQKYAFLDDYRQKSKTHYNAESASVDFMSKSEETRAFINQWVESQTNSKIKDLLPAGSVGALTRLVLVNAVYFKGNWMSKFDKKDTKKGDFTLSSGSKIRVPMMYQKKKFNFGALNCQVLEMPYQGKKMSMFIMLPKSGNISKLTDALTPAHFVDPVQTFKLRQIEVHVTIPKFKIEQTIPLKEMLAQMGMKDLFVPGVADLSGMDGTRDLYVSDVIHKSFIEVNEEGSEAAAATAVLVQTRSMPKQIEFIANKPFVYFIRDNYTQTVLFLGAMQNPGGNASKDEL